MLQAHFGVLAYIKKCNTLKGIKFSNMAYYICARFQYFLTIKKGNMIIYTIKDVFGHKNVAFYKVNDERISPIQNLVYLLNHKI